MDKRFVDELSGRIRKLVANSPVEDLQKNIKTILSSKLSKLDLVTREEFDVQQALLQRTKKTVKSMEQRIVELEEKLKNDNLL